MEGFVSEQQTVKVDATSAPTTVVVRLRPLNGASASVPPASPSPPPKTLSVPPPRPTPVPVVPRPASPPPLETQGGGHKGLVLGILGTAAAGTAVAIVVAKHQSGGCPGNPAFNDSSLSPGGAFTINVAPDLTGQVNCNTPTQPITVTGTNLDCSPVTIMSASVSASLTSGACAGGGFTRTLKVIASTVAPGGRNVPIAEGVIGNSVAGCCLNGGSCGSSSFQCDEREVYTVQTSKGPVTSSNPYTILFPAGFSCVPCDPSSASCRGPSLSGTR
jgi:hypothetical protein